MARNPLQEQLLKAGLVNKNKLDQVVRQQQKARSGKQAPATGVEAERLQAERAASERAAQLKQIIEAHRIKPGDDSDYRFEHAGAIRSLRIADAQRPLLARGALVIVGLGDSHALVNRDTAERLRAIDPAVIHLDHGTTAAPPSAADPDDEFYSRFRVPDDLVW